MATLTGSRDDVAGALALAARFTASHKSNPQLNHLRLKVGEDGVSYVEATDQRVSIRTALYAQCAEEVDTHRVILLGTGPGGVSPQRALAGFREVYPGKGDTIELAISRDWTKEAFASTCERQPFPMGELHRFWPGVMKPEGRIHFAGAYADNLNWGTEAATRSGNRVANEIDQA